MPRRAIFDRAWLDALLALPDGEAEVIRHYTLTPEELRQVAGRRRPHNRFGFALQLCALRYPGRVIRPGEAVPEKIVAVCRETGSGAKLDRVERKRVMALAQAREIDVVLVTEL